MDHEQDPISDAVADQLAVEILDGDRRDGKCTESQTLDRQLAELNTTGQLRLTDLLMLDALLEQIYFPQPAEQRIRRALAAISDADEPTAAVALAEPRHTARSSGRRGWLRWSPAVIAAVLLISTGWWAFSPRGSAYAAAQLAYDASLESVDREYRVTVERNGPMAMFPPVEAKLWVRGGKRFVLEHPGAIQGNFWFGSDGTKSWFVPVIGPVLVSNNPRWLRERAEEEKVALPFLQISAILKRASDRYTLVDLAPEQLAGNDLVEWRRIQGTLKPSAKAQASGTANQRKLPQTVDLWIHPASGVAGKVALAWEPETLKPGPRKIELELTSERRQPDDWYHYESHWAIPRAVKHVD